MDHESEINICITYIHQSTLIPSMAMQYENTSSLTYEGSVQAITVQAITVQAITVQAITVQAITVQAIAVQAIAVQAIAVQAIAVL